MDHDMVFVKNDGKLLLGELDPRPGRIEAHFFECPECALDVHAGAMFVEQSKVVLAENPSRFLPPCRRPSDPNQAGMARMAASVCVRLRLARDGLVAGGDRYQNLVTYPQMRQALNARKCCRGVGECRHLG